MCKAGQIWTCSSGQRQEHHVSVSLDTDLIGAYVDQVVQGVRVEGAV